LLLPSVLRASALTGGSVEPGWRVTHPCPWPCQSPLVLLLSAFAPLAGCRRRSTRVSKPTPCSLRRRCCVERVFA
jgi:hypothetical protein